MGVPQVKMDDQVQSVSTVHKVLPVPQARLVFKVFQVLMVPLVPQVKSVLKVQTVPRVTEVQLVPPVPKAEVVTMVKMVQPVPEVVWEVMPVKKNLSDKKFELFLTDFWSKKLQVEALGMNTSASVKLFIFMMLSSLV